MVRARSIMTISIGDERELTNTAFRGSFGFLGFRQVGFRPSYTRGVTSSSVSNSGQKELHIQGKHRVFALFYVRQTNTTLVATQ